MAFQQGLSGLSAAAKALDVTSNNIANASTIGFKGANAHFGDIFAASLGISGASQVGIGANVATVGQQFTQGNIKTTSNPLDVAINGSGFFQIQQGGEVVYSRNGQFHVSNDNYIVNDTQGNLLGYMVDEATGTQIGSLVPLTTPEKDSIMLQKTENSEISLNLDSSATEKTWATVTGENTPDVDSYNYSQPLPIYDSQGGAHTLTMYFVKTANPREWEVHFQVDGTSDSNVTAGGSNTLTLSFDENGIQTSPDPTTSVSLSINMDQVASDLGTTNSTASTLAFDTKFNLTQYGNSYVVGKLSQDGYQPGVFSSVSIGPDGLVQANYSNGQSKKWAQIDLRTFNNINGLMSVGNNVWRKTAASGPDLPIDKNIAVLQSGALEESNVDLTAELVDMIVQQRNYQANAQSIKTQDSLLQTMVNLR